MEDDTLRQLLVGGGVSVVNIAIHALVMTGVGPYLIVHAVPAGGNLVYFAFVNYTTPGYGDIVPVERWGLLGPITAPNGVLLR